MTELGSGMGGRPANTVFAHPPAKGTGIYSKKVGGTTIPSDIPTCFFKRPQNMCFFYLQKALKW